MRQFTLVIASIFALITLLSACGTKGPLTLPPDVAATPTDKALMADPNTEKAQR